MRQASRRSWRIGLSRPVKVVLMAYRNNLQADALKLVAKKPQPSLAVEGRSHLRLRLPMPGLVFVCSPGRAPWVYAAAERPADLEQHLFRAPAFNVFRDGRVCLGSHRFPEEVGLIPEGFFQSFFSLTGDTRDRSKKHPDNLQSLWEEIDGTTAYPIEDLVPQCTVAQAMAVSEGRRGYR